MIIVTGMFAFESGHEDALVAAMVDMMDESNKEDGCHHYRFYRDVQHPDRFRVYEEWESPAHLKAHSESAHMKVFRERLGKIGVKSRDVKMVEAGPSKQL